MLFGFKMENAILLVMLKNVSSMVGIAIHQKQWIVRLIVLSSGLEMGIVTLNVMSQFVISMGVIAAQARK